MRVSAVIITHNRKELLLKAVESVKLQTYKDIEIIVVDDASTDGTKKMCENMEGIKYIYIDKEKTRGGENYARNLGVEKSKGELIAFLDDDDEWFPNKTERMVQEFKDNPTYGMIYCGRKMICGRKLFDYYLVPDNFRSGDLSKEYRIADVMATSSTIMIRREVFEKIGGFDEMLRCWQDYELILRIKSACEIGVVPEVLVNYRRELSDSNRITNKYNEWVESVCYIQKKHRNFFAKISSEEQMKWKIMCLNEAAYRVVYTEHKNRMKLFYHRLFVLTKRPDYLIREIFGISRQRTFYLECLLNRLKNICDRNMKRVR